MSSLNSSPIKQRNTSGDAPALVRRNSMNEQSRMAFVEVLRGVYMKRKGQNMHWSDVKKGYKKKTGKILNHDELNGLCGTTGLTKGDIIREKFSPLLTFVDEKNGIIAVTPNDCGGTGLHQENDFLCESCLKDGKMQQSPIRFSSSSASSSNDDNKSPIKRLAEDFSEDNVGKLSTIIEPSTDEAVFHENGEADLEPESPNIKETTVRSDYAFDMEESTSSIDLRQPLKSTSTDGYSGKEFHELQHEPSDLTLKLFDKHLLIASPASLGTAMAPYSGASTASSDVIQLEIHHDIDTSNKDLAQTDLSEKHNESKTDQGDVESSLAAPLEALELDVTQSDESANEEYEHKAVIEETIQRNLEALDGADASKNGAEALELDVTQEESLVDQIEITPVEASVETIEVKETEAIELDTTQSSDGDREVHEDQSGEDSTPQKPSEDLNIEEDDSKKDAYDLDSLVTPTGSEVNVTLDEGSDEKKDLGDSGTELDTQADKPDGEPTEVCEENSGAHEKVVYRRRKAKCCSLM